MKNLFKLRYKIVFLAFLLLTGCGQLEKSCESANYETITNESGDVLLYSGGVVVEQYDNVDIIYSNSDSQAVFFKTKAGQKIYWQGDMKLVIK